MENVGFNIRKSLLKRQEAIDRFNARKLAFSIAKEQIIKDIEEAKNIWESTDEQLHNQKLKIKNHQPKRP